MQAKYSCEFEPGKGRRYLEGGGMNELGRYAMSAYVTC